MLTCLTDHENFLVKAVIDYGAQKEDHYLNVLFKNETPDGHVINRKNVVALVGAVLKLERTEEETTLKQLREGYNRMQYDEIQLHRHIIHVLNDITEIPFYLQNPETSIRAKPRQSIYREVSDGMFLGPEDSRQSTANEGAFAIGQPTKHWLS